MDDPFWVSPSGEAGGGYLVNFINGRNLPPLTGFDEVPPMWRTGLIVVLIMANISVFTVLKAKGMLKRSS